MADEHSSYSRLVFQRAWRNTWSLLKDRTMDAMVGAASMVVGAAIFLLVYGWDEMTKEVVTFLAFVLAPGGLFLIFAFLWNLCLASDELVYEAIRSLQLPSPSQTSAPAPSAQPVINWSIWRQMPKLQINEFAAILARRDPASSRSNTEQDGYRRLIMEDIAAGKLRYIIEYGVSFEGNRYQKSLTGESSLLKEFAITWAHEKNFDVSHIEQAIGPPA